MYLFIFYKHLLTGPKNPSVVEFFEMSPSEIELKWNEIPGKVENAYENLNYEFYFSSS